MTAKTGSEAPEFSLRGIDGETYALSDALGRGPAVLVFFKTTCSTCDTVFPYINRLAASYSGHAWSLWAVAQDSPGDAGGYASSHGISYPVLPDVDAYHVSKQYDPPATPTIYLVDREGQVIQRSEGLSKAELNALSAELAERLKAQAVEIAPADDGNPPFKPG